MQNCTGLLFALRSGLVRGGGAAAGRVSLRGHTRQLLEVHIEIVQVGVARALGDLLDAHVRVLEQVLGLLNAHPVDALPWK